jgi:hypothetical protein
VNGSRNNFDDLLQGARIPERVPGYWEKFPHGVMGAVRNDSTRRASVDTPPGPSPWRLAWAVGLATACLALGFRLGLRQGKGLAPDQQELAAARKLFKEISSLFPNRLQSIVIEGANVQLVLSEGADVPASTPLLVEICQDGKCRSYVTFSGQQIRWNGESYEVLSDAKGNVIVVGRGVVWTSAEPLGMTQRLRIQAQQLEMAL